MSASERPHRLTPRAEIDLEDIWLYTFQNRSLEQADRYQNEINFGVGKRDEDRPPSRYAWDMRAAYVIGTRHKEDYQLFVPRELAPDLTALTGQVMRQREDKGSSLRFEAAKAYDMRHRLGGELFSQKLSATLEKGREVLTAAAQAERERLRQAEELSKTQELKHTLKPRGPSMGR